MRVLHVQLGLTGLLCGLRFEVFSIEVFLIFLLLLGLLFNLVKLHNADQSDQSDNADDTPRSRSSSRGSTSASDLSSLRCARSFRVSHERVSEPTNVGDERECGDDVQPEEEVQPIVLLDEALGNNLQSEERKTHDRTQVEVFVDAYVRSCESDIVSKQRVGCQHCHEKSPYPVLDYLARQLKQITLFLLVL